MSAPSKVLLELSKTVTSMYTFIHILASDETETSENVLLKETVSEESLNLISELSESSNSLLNRLLSWAVL